MASIPASMESNAEQPLEADGRFIRVIVADGQAIFRAGLRKIFALEDNIRVVGQSETLAQTLSAAKKFSADILILEAALAANPAEAVTDLLRQTPGLRLVVVTAQPDEELTLELLRRGAHAIVARDVEPELLVDCLRKVAEGHPCGCSRPTAPRPYDPSRPGRGCSSRRRNR
jgi:DNA-binding NarL/FixJ family response regulator